MAATSLSCRAWTIALTLLAGVASAAVPERTWLRTDIPPERREGRAFIPLRAAAIALGAEVEWRPQSREVVLSRNQRQVLLRIGELQATVNGRTVRLEAPPYVRSGRTLVPVRFTAEALAVPVSYEEATESVLLGPGSDGVLWLLPLESMRRGIVVHTPTPLAEVTSPVRVHGQANEFEGNVVVQIQDSHGQVLAEGVGTGAMGAFGPFTVTLSYTLPHGAVQHGRILAFSPSAKDGRPLDTVSIPVQLR